MVARKNLFASLALLVSLSVSPLAVAQDASAILNDDGSVTIAGIAQPGQNVSVPEACLGEASQPAIVVCAADIFLNALSEDQKAQVLLPITEENSTAWSNLPCGSSCRVGIQLSELDDTQIAAALAVVKAATSDYGDDGFDELTQVMMADDILSASQASGEGGGPGAMDENNASGEGGEAPNGMAPPDGAMGTPPDGAMGTPPDGGAGGGYSSTTYFIAILGTPSTEDTWQLQFGGHHLALLKTYKGNAEIGSTPNFIGVEPKIWTDGDRIYGPLEDDRAAMAAMLAGLNADQLAAAKLDAMFSDVVLGPGADGQFPETKAGLAVSELDEEQKQLVLAAMSEWVRDTASDSADAIMAAYEDGLDETYIAYSGNISLSNHADYVRIDGPRVWIEFVCQDGVVYSSEIHYHTIWRDHETDYGAVYSF